METKRRTESGNKDHSLPLSLLRLLAPPMQLLSAAMWQVMQRGLVSHYGMLEEFVTTVTELVPELMSYKQRAQLILGLRARLVLDLCDGEQPADHSTIQVHLDRIKAPIGTSTDHNVIAQVEETEVNFAELVHTLLENPSEREHFFQDVFPVHFGSQYDTALEILLWEFIARLEELLPVPDFTQMLSWLSDAPSVLEEYLQSVTPPTDIKAVVEHHRNIGAIDVKEPSSPSSSLLDDCILSALSLNPMARPDIDAARTNSTKEDNVEINVFNSDVEKRKRISERTLRWNGLKQEEVLVETLLPNYDTARSTTTPKGWQGSRKRKLSDRSDVPLKQPTEAALFVDASEEADHPGESPLISIWGEYTDPQESAYPVTTDAKVPWSDEETLNLLDIWGKDSVQKVLKGCVKNRHIFSLISTKMTERGFVRTVEQCQTRIKRLKKCFRQCLQHNNTSGNARLECKFYEQLERILGSAAPSAALEDADTDQPQSSEEWSFLGHSGLEAVGTRSVPWTDSETLTLIDIWGEDRIQRDLKGMHRNGHIFSVISNKMAAQGFIRTAEQCQTRVKRLKASFRHCYDYNLEGREHVECKFYDQLERILVNELPTYTSVAENSLDAMETESKQEDSLEDEFPVPSYHEIEPAMGTPEERKKVPWRDEETLMLLELWGDEKVQLNLKRCPHNGHIYSGISEQLTAQGYYRTAEQCHTRIKRLKASYRQCQGSISSSGSERVDFKFYDILEQILEGQPSTFSTTESLELAEDSNSNSLGNTGLDLEEGNSNSALLKASQSSWLDHESLDLIAIWGEQEVLKVLRGFGHHGDVYNDISEKMHHLGHTRTAEQCRVKVTSMKQDFRQCYDNKKCGRSKVECKFYDQLERLLGQDQYDQYDERDEQADQDIIIGDDSLTYSPWTEPETIALIELWVCEETQQKPKGGFHSGRTSEDISDRMASLGHFRTAEQCHARITQLHQTYSQCRNSLRNGEEPPVFRYYRFLESVLGDISPILDTDNTDHLFAEEEPDIEEQPPGSLVLSETSRKMPWTEPETRALLDIWGENGVQIKLRSCLKNRHVFEYISQRMESRGFIRTTDQCHTRVKRLKAGYHLEKKDFKFYEQMEEIFTRELPEEDGDADVSEVEAPPVVSESPHESDLINTGDRINDGSKYPWGDNETQVLLDLWGSEDIQESLRGCSKNKHIFTQISQAMCSMGYMRTAEQCLSRVKRLKAQFRQYSQSKRSGVEKVEWKFYNQFQQIFGEKNPTTAAEDSNSAATGGERTARRSR